jgi:Uma2 family endonuclease
MGMPALSERYWTAADVRLLPDDGNRYECIDGALLVTPAPRGLHQMVLRSLFRALDPFVSEHALGELFWSPADVELELGTLVQPDLFVGRLRSGVTRFTGWPDIASLRLAIEVLSPSTARYDRVTKREFYLRAGVEEYWIVDLDARLVERWQQGATRPEVATERLVWSPSEASRPLELDLAGLFGAILGP